MASPRIERVAFGCQEPLWEVLGHAMPDFGAVMHVSHARGEDEPVAGVFFASYLVA